MKNKPLTNTQAAMLREASLSADGSAIAAGFKGCGGRRAGHSFVTASSLERRELIVKIGWSGYTIYRITVAGREAIAGYDRSAVTVARS